MLVPDAEFGLRTSPFLLPHRCRSTHCLHPADYLLIEKINSVLLPGTPFNILEIKPETITS